jgi:hypothetical protein
VVSTAAPDIQAVLCPSRVRAFTFERIRRLYDAQLIAKAEMEPRAVALRRAHALPNDAVMAAVHDELADAADAVHP